MTEKRQLLVLVAIALLAGAGGYLAYRNTVAVPDGAGVSAGKVPEFVLPDLTGSDRQGSEWSGRARLLNFWATWCPPCRREIPLLIDLQAEYGSRLAVIGIAIDDMEAVREYAVENQFNYPVLVGQQNAVELGNRVLADWIGLPFTAFVNASGDIVRVHVGELHRDQAETYLAEIL
ncbi:MAG: TlpA disulfide reductase family protein [Gammaproteobacteria bacterium]|jgi:thiol-disulfide isomerase/thioredoxin